MRKALSVMRSRVSRNHFNFSSDSHAWSAAPVCKTPHLYFLLEASSIPSTILAQATPPRLPRPPCPQPRRNSRQLQTEE